jgi:hypothetical protein
VPDLEALYNSTLSNAAVDGKGAPAGRSVYDLSAWVQNRGGAAQYNGDGLSGWIGGYSPYPPSTSGQVSYGTPGAYYFTVPYYNTLTATVIGAGGGGGAQNTGGDGAASAFGGLSVPGGSGGGPENSSPTNGASGGNGAGSPGGTGSVSTYSGKDFSGTTRGGNGGNGGSVVQAYAAGQLTPGSVVAIVVGAGGAAAAGGITQPATAGVNGQVQVRWN